MDLFSAIHFFNAKRYKIHENILCGVKAKIFVGNSRSRERMNAE